MTLSPRFSSGSARLGWRVGLLSCLLVFWGACSARAQALSIPLPEHPRPDFQRPDWRNLNGPWAFRFDPANEGETGQWQNHPDTFSDTITVPFPWGSKLSGLESKADIGWYGRAITVPGDWKGKRVFLVVGASDWTTTAWLDGQKLGQYRGGYTPFEFELTAGAKLGATQQLVLRVDDTPHPFKLEGKQGYGAAKGLWQTVYLEARGASYLDTIQFFPDIDQERVLVKAVLDQPAATDLKLRLKFAAGDLPEIEKVITAGQRELPFEVPIPQARLWSLEDPFLYDVTATLTGEKGPADELSTYFGMRHIGVMKLPLSGFPYITLNHQPVYLQMTLDQCYHPEGFYTFPTDQFMKEEILRSRAIGLNAQRLHVKIELPRKLYWADRLGILLMADVPNSWGEPDAEMRGEVETALRGMLRRDFNHPSIFSWVIFNETWGLKNKDKVFAPETQDWTTRMYRLAKDLDPTRLVEDDSACNNDHVETDINSWHVYLPGFGWREHLDQVVKDTFPGSKWNFIGGRAQGDQPLLNSECGNVWGYEGSTGDVDWSWDYHIMMNEFRRHPKICGWLYTEHHDVINEWNGYYRFDRSEKVTGLDELVPGMTLRDWHSPYYIATGGELCQDAKPGETVTVPIRASSVVNRGSGGLKTVLKAELYGWDSLGQREVYQKLSRAIDLLPWASVEADPLEVTLPNKPALAVLALILEDGSGEVLHRNFTTFRVAPGATPRAESLKVGDTRVQVVRFAPPTFSSAQWSLKQWNVLDGLKVNGAGHGYFEYRVPWPENLDPRQIAGASLRFEASAKQLFGKDREGSSQQDGDYMRGKGNLDPSLNPNSYPMTDTKRFPSAVRVRVAGVSAGTYDLPDDPADHRGILSWHAQKRDKKLREAGSYGYLVNAPIPPEALAKAVQSKELRIRFEVDSALPGGLAIYGEQFGRYPLDPTLVFMMKP